jgi:hypothetical protein
VAAQGYRDWLNAGQPYTLIRPAKAVQRLLRAEGLVVYDYPNEAHQKAATPEDHTPYSATSWPIKNARWRGHALDVMPLAGVPAAQANAENAAIARQLIRDRDAQVPGAMWIKYINWTDERGVCRQVRWEDGRSERSSTDKGHIHISGRSDCADDARADGYNPLARARAGLTGDDDMQLSDKNPFGTSPRQFTAEDEDAALWLMDGPNGNVGTTLQYILENTHFARRFARKAAAESTALHAVIEQLAGVIASGGGSVDTAAILAGVQLKLDALAAEQRDAVADLGEGGAAQVRADQD